MSQHVGPDGVLRIGRLEDNPKASLGMINDGDRLAPYRSDRPGFAQEVQSVIGVELALMVESQVQVQQRDGGHRAVVVAFFLEGQFPGGVGGPAGGAADLVLIVPGDLDLQQGVGVGVVGDLLESQEADEAFLEGVKAAFDFAFGLGVGGDAVGTAQGDEGALELGVGVEALGGGGRLELARVEGGQDFLDVEGLDPVSELFLFIGAAR